MNKQLQIGKITRISGSVVIGKGFSTLKKNVIVQMGPERILGESVEVEKNKLIIQAYEETEGLRIGDEIYNYNEPFYAILGPGLLGTIIDGLERPLVQLSNAQGAYLQKGSMLSPFSHELKFEFIPSKSINDFISNGEEIGYVIEKGLKHPILTKISDEKTQLVKIVTNGKYSPNEVLAELSNGEQVKMTHLWEIRKQRPYLARLDKSEPYITGQRIIDTIFPIQLGGSAIISGGFGTGKTILEQTLAKYSKVDVTVLVLIGERGNEVANALHELQILTDENGRPIIERTIIVVNTSNMPVAAREASIYLGMTIAEYYRDLGFKVCLLADSTSRWAEAVREISGRLEEMPGEEGYPSYMPKKLGEFFERTGLYETLNHSIGSMTFIAAISPPGGDFTEPVTQSALRVCGAFWALNTDLARSRHFPAIDWKISFSHYGSNLAKYYSKNMEFWENIRFDFLHLLKMEEELEHNVRLLGRDSLTELQKGVLDMIVLFKKTFLQQDAFDPIDCDTSLDKQYLMLLTLHYLWLYAKSEINKGITSEDFFQKSDIKKISRIREISEDEMNKLVSYIEEFKQKLGEIK